MENSEALNIIKNLDIKPCLEEMKHLTPIIERGYNWREARSISVHIDQWGMSLDDAIKHHEKLMEWANSEEH